MGGGFGGGWKERVKDSEGVVSVWSGAVIGLRWEVVIRGGGGCWRRRERGAEGMVLGLAVVMVSKGECPSYIYPAGSHCAFL